MGEKVFKEYKAPSKIATILASQMQLKKFSGFLVLRLNSYVKFINLAVFSDQIKFCYTI